MLYQGLCKKDFGPPTMHHVVVVIRAEGGVWDESLEDHIDHILYSRSQNSLIVYLRACGRDVL